jgi:hypothetical protein
MPGSVGPWELLTTEDAEDHRGFIRCRYSSGCCLINHQGHEGTRRFRTHISLLSVYHYQSSIGEQHGFCTGFGSINSTRV